MITRIDLTRVVMTALLATSLAVAAVAAAPSADAKGGAANKVSASGSALEVFGTGDGEPVNNGDGEVVRAVELLSAEVKLSTPEDLILSVALECSISTELMTVGNSSANASGTLEVWIEIDGNVIPVALDELAADYEGAVGEVTFCSRSYGRTTSFTDDEDHAIDSHIRTKAAQAFNWLGLDETWANGSDNIHEIRVLARLRQEATGTDGADATALVTVGKRTLIIEPTKVANGEVVELG